MEDILRAKAKAIRSFHHRKSVLTAFRATSHGYCRFHKAIVFYLSFSFPNTEPVSIWREYVAKYFGKVKTFVDGINILSMRSSFILPIWGLAYVIEKQNYKFLFYRKHNID